MNRYPESVVSAFMTYCKLEDIARETGLSTKTLSKYRADPELQKILAERSSAAVSGALRSMQNAMQDSSQELIKIIRNPKTPQRNKLSAINILLNQCRTWTETADILQRIAELEKRMDVE